MKRNHVKKAIAVTAFAMMIIIGETKSYAASKTVTSRLNGYYTEGSSQFNGANYMTLTHCAAEASLSLSGHVRFVQPYTGTTSSRQVSKSERGTEVVVRDTAPTGYRVLSMEILHKVVKGGTWTQTTYVE